MVRRFFTVGVKLGILLTLLLSSAIACLVWLATQLFSRDSVALIQQINADAATALSAEFRAYFDQMGRNATLMGLVMYRDGKSLAVQEFMARHESIRAIFVVRHSGNEAIEEAVASARSQPPIFRDAHLVDWEQALRRARLSFTALESGEPQVAGVDWDEGKGLVALGLPLIKRPEFGFSHSVIVLFDAGALPDAFGDAELVLKYLLDREGRVLVGAGQTSDRASLAHLPIVKEFMDRSLDNLQMRYSRRGEADAVFGAVRKVGFAGLSVLAEVPQSRALESVSAVERRALWLGLVVLSLALLAGHWFADSLTWPLKQLAAAAGKIAHGDFAVRVKPSSRDEIGALSSTFNEMARGLQERERLRDTFKKFHSEAIAERIMSGQIHLGGENLTAAVLFMDLRDFTAFSEGLQPQQVVEQLNEYFERMVSVIQRYNGIVDKYVGDAIMAAWGVPVADPDAPVRAIAACLEIRRSLAELNQLRTRRGQAALRIGMGVHYGPVTAGNIGSSDRMEYTLIGDTVNLASRVESLTKEVETDLLVTRAVKDIVKGRFEYGPGSEHKVKGKSMPVEVFGVVGVAKPAAKPAPAAAPTPTEAGSAAA